MAAEPSPWRPLLSLAEALHVAKKLHGYGAPASLVPILDHQSGDFTCFDVETSEVVFWDHETRGTTTPHPDLATALERLWLQPLRTAAEEVVR